MTQTDEACGMCQGDRVYHIEDELGGIWQIACPNCVGYLDRDGKTLRRVTAPNYLSRWLAFLLARTGRPKLRKRHAR